MTYSLFTRPVSWHKIAVLAILVLILMVWHVVKFILEIRIEDEIVEELFGIVKPYFVFGTHPCGHRSIGELSVIVQWKRVKGSIPQSCWINNTVQIIMVTERWCCVIWSKICCPETEKDINIAPRHLILRVQKIGKFEFNTVIVWTPIIWPRIHFTWRRRGPFIQIKTRLVTNITFDAIREEISE